MDHSFVRVGQAGIALRNLLIISSAISTGPSELTIFLPEAIVALDGPGSDCTKSDWYDVILPLRPLVNLRDKHEHDKRRRAWDKGFSIKGIKHVEIQTFQSLQVIAMRNYNSRVLKYGRQLEQHFQRTAGQSVRVDDWFHFFSFDVMGDLALAKSYNMLIDEKWHYSIILMHQFMSYLGPFSAVPWLCRLGLGLPRVASGWKRFVQYCKERLVERLQVRKKMISFTLQSILSCF